MMILLGPSVSSKQIVSYQKLIVKSMERNNKVIYASNPNHDEYSHPVLLYKTENIRKLLANYPITALQVVPIPNPLSLNAMV